MKMRFTALLIALMPVIASPAAAFAAEAPAEAPRLEAKPFDEHRDATADADAAIARAKANKHKVILVFGANWCGDSRALAGWFESSRFKSMLDANYELVWVDVGQKDRNLDLARRFGLDGIKGTPTVLILDPKGQPINLDDAPSWKNARSRSEDEIYTAFAGKR
jgi:thioredoxin-like negative regulator of GroEL